MKKILGLSLVAAMALTNVYAEEAAVESTDSSKFAMSGSAAMTTNYLWRGWTYTNETPTGQAGVNFENIANVEGFSFGLWGSGIQVGSEVDFDVSFSNSISDDLSYSVGHIYYLYTLAGSSYGEAYLGLSYGDYSLTVYKESNSLADGITPIVDASFGAIDVQAGYYIKSSGSAAFGSVGVNWPCTLDETYNMNLTAAYNSAATANTVFTANLSGAALALTISKDF